MKYEYCPNGNNWTEISGILDNKSYYYCDCNKCNGKVYELRPVDITKKIKNNDNMDYCIEKAEKEFFWKKARSLISYNNSKQVLDFINNLIK